MLIYCYGDSNTYGYDPRSFLGGRYPKHMRWTGILENTLGCRIVNGGMNGRRIPGKSGAELLAGSLGKLIDENAESKEVDAESKAVGAESKAIDAESEAVDAESKAVDAESEALNAGIHLLIMLGTNDLLNGMGAAEVAVRMSDFLESLLEYPAARETHPMLISPPKLRRGSWVEDDMLVEQSALLGAAMRLVAMKHGLDFLDAGEIEVDVVFDGVHFSERGHRAFADFVSGAYCRDRHRDAADGGRCGTDGCCM